MVTVVVPSGGGNGGGNCYKSLNNGLQVVLLVAMAFVIVAVVREAVLMVMISISSKPIISKHMSHQTIHHRFER